MFLIIFLAIITD